MLLIHLPYGPTAHFKISNVKLRREIKNSTTPSKHKPEVSSTLNKIAGQLWYLSSCLPGNNYKPNVNLQWDANLHLSLSDVMLIVVNEIFLIWAFSYIFHPSLSSNAVVDCKVI